MKFSFICWNLIHDLNFCHRRCDVRLMILRLWFWLRRFMAYRFVKWVIVIKLESRGIYKEISVHYISRAANYGRFNLIWLSRERKKINLFYFNRNRDIIYRNIHSVYVLCWHETFEIIWFSFFKIWFCAAWIAAKVKLFAE